MGALLVATLVGAAVFLLTYAVAWLTVRDQSAFDEVVGLVGFLVYVGIPVGAVSLWAWRFARRRWGDRMTWRGAAMWTGRLVGWIAVFTLWLWVIWDFTTLAWPPDGALVLSLVAAAGLAWGWVRGRPLFRQVALLIPIAVLGCWAVGRVWDSRYRAFLVELRREGIKTSLADYAQVVPERDNAAPPIRSWSIKYKVFDGRRWEKERELIGSLFTSDGSETPCRWSPQGNAALNAVISRAPAYFASLDRDIAPMLSIRSRYYPVDWEAISRNPYSDSWRNHLGLPIEYLSRGFRVLAERDAQRGRDAYAWRRVQLQVQLVDLLRQDAYSIIGVDSCLRAMRIAAQTAGAILANRPNAVIPSPVAGHLVIFLGGQWTLEAWRMEFAQCIDLRMRDRRTGWWIVRGRSMGWMTALDHDLRTLSRPSDASALASYASFWLPIVQGRVGFRVTSQHVSSFFAREADEKTGLQLVLIESAIHAWRNAHGALPAELGQLAPKFIARDTLIDRYSGKLLGYEPDRDGRGFFLYSVGVAGDRLRCGSRWNPLVVREPLPPPVKKRPRQ